MRVTTVCTSLRARALSVAALSALLCVSAGPAAASPVFNLVISSGGVNELAVGATLQLRALHPPVTCLPSPYVGRTKSPVTPTEAPLVWSVEPADLGSITQDGVLTAKEPGSIRVRVECRDPKAPECRLIEPGTRSFFLNADLPAGRLPRVDGGPAIESFTLQWDATPFQSRHEFSLSITGGGFAWALGMGTPATPDHEFPWVLEPAKDRRGFDDDEGRDEPKAGEARHRANVTSARITLDSWKDGILSGRLALQTTRGVEFDTTFQTRLADRDGVLAKAAAATPEPKPAPRAPDPGTK